MLKARTVPEIVSIGLIIYISHVFQRALGGSEFWLSGSKVMICVLLDTAFLQKDFIYYCFSTLHILNSVVSCIHYNTELFTFRHWTVAKELD